MTDNAVSLTMSLKRYLGQPTFNGRLFIYKLDEYTYYEIIFIHYIKYDKTHTNRKFMLVC